MKRIYITLLVLMFGMIGMVYLYFSNLNTETEANDISLNAIASNSAIVFSFENDKSFYEILNGQDLLQNILGTIKSRDFKSLRENLADQKEINGALGGQKIYVGFLQGKNNEIDYLIGTQLKSESDTSKILTILNSKTKVKKEGNTYQIVFADSTTCYIGLRSSLVLISNTSTSIERVLKSQNIDKEFVEYIKSNNKFSKNTLATLQVNFFTLPQILKNVLNTNLTGELSLFKNQKAYASLNYNFSSEKLLFNGSTKIEDLNSYYNLFAQTSDQNISIDNILPEKTANFATYAVKDYDLWFADLKKLHSRRKELAALEKNIAHVNQNYRVDLTAIFSQYFKNELITFQVRSGEKFGAIALKDGEKVNQLLLDLSIEYSPGVRIFKDAKIAYYFFGDPFKKFEKPFYTIIDNYLVMANYASSIQTFLNDYNDNNLLINDEDYINFSNQLSSSSTICYYVNNKNSNDIFGRNIKSSYYKQYQSKTGFKDYVAFCYQLSGDNGNFLTNLLLLKKPEKASNPDTLRVTP